jgi:hypothetical protein
MRNDGYYLGGPNPYVDYVAGENKRTGVVYWAYLFLDNGVAKRKSKETKTGVVSFNKDDFENAYSAEYTLKGEFLDVVFDKNQKWELRMKFRISGDQIINIETNSATGTGHVYEFKKW